MIKLRRRTLLFAGGAFALLPLGTLAASDEEQTVTTLFNQIRRDYGLGVMIADDQLTSAAQTQAHLMAREGKLSHTVGWGNGFRARLRRAGIHGAAAENIAAGQPDFHAVFAAWMRSPNHRRNMLDRGFSRYGLAYATSPERLNYRYWALLLGR